MKYIPYLLVLFMGCTTDSQPIKVEETETGKNEIIISLKEEIRIMEAEIDSLESQSVIDTDKILSIMSKLDGARFKNVLNQDLSIRLSKAKMRVKYLEDKHVVNLKSIAKKKVSILKDSLRLSDSTIGVLKKDIKHFEEIIDNERLTIVDLEVRALKKTNDLYSKVVKRAKQAEILYCSFSVPESNVIERKDYYVNFKVHSVLDSSFIASKTKIRYKGASEKIEVRIPLNKSLMKGVRNVSVEIEDNDTAISNIYLR